MFAPRRPTTQKPQKNRHWGTSPARLWQHRLTGFRLQFVALGPGHLSPSLVERVYIWAKRASPAVTTLRRFWVNLQAAAPLTQKPINVRMGKGKGGRVGMHTRVHTGCRLLCFSALRPGLLKAITRRLQVRCAFPIGVLSSSLPDSLEGSMVGQPTFWTRWRRVQARHLTPRFIELREAIKRLRRPPLLGYFFRLFWWRHAVAHAQWVPGRLERRQARPRRRLLQRRRYMTRLQPQGVGFFRQLRVRVRQFARRTRELRLRPWRKAQYRWSRQLWSAVIFQQFPTLPWHRLLRARRYRRLLPFLTFAAVADAGGWREAPISLARCIPGVSNLNTVLGSQPTRLTAAQLLAVTLYWRWALVIAFPISFRWLRRR